MRITLFFKESILLFFTLFVLASCQENNDFIPENVRDIKASSPDENYGKKIDGMVYVGSDDGKVYALDFETGAKKWEFPTGAPVKSSPAVADGLVYVGTLDNKIYALDAEIGNKVWESDFGPNNTIFSSPTVVNGTVYIANSHEVYALNAQTGDKIWSFTPNNDLAGFKGSPVVVNGILYIGEYFTGLDNFSFVFALDAANGNLTWVFNDFAGSSLETYGSPAYANNMVYFAAGNLYAFDAESGKVMWQTPPPADYMASPFVASNGVIYVQTDFKLYAYNAMNGTELWNVATEGGASLFNLSGPVAANGNVYVPHLFGISALDESNGEKKWTIKSNNGRFSGPTIHWQIGGTATLFTGNEDDHKVYAFDATTGVKKWEFLTGGAIFSSPTVITSSGQVEYPTVSGMKQ